MTSPAFISLLTARRSATQPPVIDGAAGAAVGLDHVAIDSDLTLTKRLPVNPGAQAPSDQPLDLDRASALLARGGLAPHAGVGGARQHTVFGGDPALAGIAQERGHPFLQRRGAEHVRVADLDHAGAFGMFGRPDLD
jgi:hypothetical protein